MTTPFLVDDLEGDEGLRLTAYQDTVGVWTIGYGHTGPEVVPGLVWTDDEASDALGADIARAEASLDAQLPWWRTLNDVRQDVIVEMAFNLGVGGLLRFKHMLADVEAGLYGLAAAQMLMSEWADQVGARAMRLSILMEHGVRANAAA
jgi:lysozyme